MNGSNIMNISKKYVWYILVNLLMFGQFCQAKPISWMENQFNEANDNYQNGNYDRAIALYEGISEAKLISSSLEYNLGNAYYETKQLAKSLLHYYRAHKLAPRDKEVKNNISIAESLLKDEIIKKDIHFLVWLWGIPSDWMSARELKIVSLFLFWLCFICMIGFINRAAKLKVSFFLIFILLLWFTTNTIWQVREDKVSPQAVVLMSEVNVKQSPKEISKTKFMLHEGTRVKVLEQRYSWCKILLPNGLNGWLEKESIINI